MSLTVVSVPIGNLDDISARALRCLREAEAIIGEERKPLFQMLKLLDVTRPEIIEYLNEHSTEQDLLPLIELCKTKKTVLVSDCGTPVFCDPGSQLISLCRKNKIPVTSAPGASSLMMLLSLSATPLKEFYFRGFLPAKTEQRRQALMGLKSFKCPIVLMDTPYRLKALLTDLKEILRDHTVLLGINLTAENELVIQTPLRDLKIETLPEKAEFILLVY